MINVRQGSTQIEADRMILVMATLAGLCSRGLAATVVSTRAMAGLTADIGKR